METQGILVELVIPGFCNPRFRLLVFVALIFSCRLKSAVVLLRMSAGYRHVCLVCVLVKTVEELVKGLRQLVVGTRLLKVLVPGEACFHGSPHLRLCEELLYRIHEPCPKAHVLQFHACFRICHLRNKFVLVLLAVRRQHVRTFVKHDGLVQLVEIPGGFTKTIRQPSRVMVIPVVGVCRHGVDKLVGKHGGSHGSGHLHVLVALRIIHLLGIPEMGINLQRVVCTVEGSGA